MTVAGANCTSNGYGYNRGRGGAGQGVACRSCDDSISISTPTPLAPHWQAKHLVTHRCRVQRGAWNYLATLCSSKLLPLLHIACHTYCVSSRYNYACCMYLMLRLLWLPSRLLDRTLKQTFTAAVDSLVASSVCFAFRWQLLTGHQYTSLIRSVYKAKQICKHRKWIMVCHYHNHQHCPHQPRQHDCDFLWHMKSVYQISMEFKFKLKSIAQAFLPWRISKVRVFSRLTFAWCVDKALLAWAHSTIVCRDVAAPLTQLFKARPPLEANLTHLSFDPSRLLALQRGNKGKKGQVGVDVEMETAPKTL